MNGAAQVFPNDTLMLTRKVTEDWLLLRPEPETIALIAYLIVYWAGRRGIVVYAIIVLGNHIHIVYRDPRGVSPAWVCMIDHWIARLMNQRLGRTRNNFFKAERSRPMRLADPIDVLLRLNYVVTNAVRHGLCARSYDWPGLIWGPENAGEKRTLQRPPELKGSEVFPDKIEFTIPAPHIAPPPQGYAALRKATEAEESQKRDGKFLGVARAMTTPRFSRPKTVKKSKFKPFFAAKNPTRRAELAKSRRQFLAQYREAMDRFRAGERDVEWPPGTYKMRHQYALPPP